MEAEEDLPRWKTAIMDGYAVRRGDLENADTVKIRGEVYAGQEEEGEIGPGEGVYVTTGSKVPKGADLVVKIEDTTGNE